MPAIRRVQLRNFRGFGELEVIMPSDAIVVGEPGAGSSDLVEAIARVLDENYWRSRRGDELDFHDMDASRPAEVELIVGGLDDPALDALMPHLEFWDRVDKVFIGALADPGLIEPDRHEPIVRVAYRLWTRDDGRVDEVVHWPKSERPGREPYLVRRAERAYLPFVWQRSVAARPLDLAVRGHLRDLIEAQEGESFDVAVERFLAAVSVAAEEFSKQERVDHALEAVFEPLRAVRRFPQATPAAELLRFLPEGGATSGLLRSLSAALTLEVGPQALSAWRHGTTALAALQAGLLIAAANARPGAIVVVDDMSANLEPSLARYLANQLRALPGQAIVAARSPAIAKVFEPDEIVRLSWNGGSREVHAGTTPVSKADRIAQRYFASHIIPALSASAVVLVEGIHDRLALDSLGLRASAAGLTPSFEAAGLEVIECDGNGNIFKVAEQAHRLGLFVVGLYDNDDGPGAPVPDLVLNGATTCDVVLYLPPRTAIEQILVRGLADTALASVLADLAAAIPGLRLPGDWRTRSGADLEQVAIDVMHGTNGSIHAAFVRALDAATLSPDAIRLLNRLHGLATQRTETGVVAL